uniref:Uncharacterized protein n=1 Tax=Rousettus aegyptiacus TaxID=9407 RepID=A0A7J8ILV5_ROUAE|nr:hypothetical protein HJG63_010719 [Rousettus aegyptiacus]
MRKWRSPLPQNGFPSYLYNRYCPKGRRPVDMCGLRIQTLLMATLWVVTGEILRVLDRSLNRVRERMLPLSPAPYPLAQWRGNVIPSPFPEVLVCCCGLSSCNSTWALSNLHAMCKKGWGWKRKL